MTSLGNLSKNPVIEKETVFTEYGATFIPVDIHFGKLDDNQKAIALEITKKLCEPISKNEFGMLYAKMRLLCVRKDVDVDEKMAMYAYYEGLAKYPASVVRRVMSKPYKFFPSFYELDENCQIEGQYIELLKRKMKRVCQND